jgi:ElaB/YqjD/DUF883 family membrane-anchored ribosome-binding protein
MALRLLWEVRNPKENSMATSPRSARQTAGTGSGTTAGNPNDTAQDLAADLARLREDVAKLAAQLQAIGEQSVKTARRAATEKVDQLRAQGEAAMSDLRENAGELEDQLVARVREKPITSLAMAAGLGYLLAMIMRR